MGVSLAAALLRVCASQWYAGLHSRTHLGSSRICNYYT
jgi:hypothetical protein